MLSAYSTQKQVKLLDRKLGILYSGCILLVLGYVIGVRVILERGYNAHEKSYGVVGAQLNGTTYMRTGNGSAIPHDVASLANVQGVNTIFLPTRIITSREQQLGNCTSPDETCQVDADCDNDPPLASGLCTGGHCQRHAWCNAGGASSQAADPFTGRPRNADEETLEATAFASLQLVLMSNIQFPTLGRSALSTEDGRTTRFRWDMTQILLRARLDQADAVANGAVLAVTLQWACYDLFDEADCAPHLLATSLGSRQPYLQSWAQYYRRGTAQSALYRDALQARGLRLQIRSEGTGERLDALQIVTQFFVALALFPIAAYLADAIMQHLFSERRHYREYKTELSPDFSDVRAKVEQLEEQSQSRQSRAMNYAA